MISTLLKVPEEIFTNPPRWIPTDPTLDGYRAALSVQIMRNFWNSIVIVAGSTVIALFLERWRRTACRASSFAASRR